MYDLIVIGAGVNGAGIARDATLRGLKTLLLDKADLAAGTTAYSTRLIHGGLRYLEYAEVHLVRESLREREVLLRNAPHLVKPLPLLIPIYQEHKRGPFLIWCGMLAYDLLSFDKSVDHHHMLSTAAALRRAPGLNPQGLKGAALYYDAQVEYAERLVVENTLSAVAGGAELRTHTEVLEVLSEGTRVRGVVVRDASGQTQTLQARAVLNVTGPWVDRLLSRTGRDMPAFMGGTKGSHLVVRPFPGMPVDGLYVEAHEDGRPFFILPWNNLALIGTTDLRSDEELDTMQASQSEREYLLRETNRVIPGAGLTNESILYTYSGVRPLPATPKGSTAAITRRHIVHDHAPELRGLFSVVGGKLTTYRNLAEHAVDKIMRYLGLKVPCRTAALALPGCTHKHLEPYRADFARRHRLDARSCDHLLRVYGERAEEVMALAERDPELRKPICSDTGALGAEVLLAVESEFAATLADIMLRRTMVGFGPRLGLGEADQAAAAIARRFCGWTEERCERELADYRHAADRLAQPQLRG